MGETTRIWMDDKDGLIIVGDVLDGLEHLDDNSVEAIVTDPPYDLLQASRKGSGRSNNPDSPAGRHGTKTGGFMGMAWDATGVAFDPKTWEACLRVLKPGGYMVVFGGTRTHHRMWCAIEDAGFEVRDMLNWLYGTGFPKSLDVSKAIDKTAGAKREVTGIVDTRSTFDGRERKSAAINTNWRAAEGREDVRDLSEKTVTAPATVAAKQWEGYGTALKPAVEPILLARKPLSEPTVAANVLKWGTGALAIDATRVEGAYAWRASDSKEFAGSSFSGGSFGEGPHTKGRWPPNVIFECTCDDPQPLPEKARRRKNEPSQEQRYTEEGATNFAAKPGARREGGGFVHQPDCPAGMLDEQTGEHKSGKMKAGQQRKQTKGGGGYHGNFPDEATAKDTYGDSGGVSRFFYCSKASKKERGEGNTHPTTKPLALMRWLIRLVTPPDGIVLDPFCGSGSTLVAAVEEGHSFVGIDQSSEYCAIAQRRVEGAERG